MEGTLAKTRVEQSVLANLARKLSALLYAERGAEVDEREEWERVHSG